MPPSELVGWHQGDSTRLRAVLRNQVAGAGDKRVVDGAREAARALTKYEGEGSTAWGERGGPRAALVMH